MTTGGGQHTLFLRLLQEQSCQSEHVGSKYEVNRWPVAVVLNEMFQDLFDIYQKAMLYEILQEQVSVSQDQENDDPVEDASVACEAAVGAQQRVLDTMVTEQGCIGMFLLTEWISGRNGSTVIEICTVLFSRGRGADRGEPLPHHSHL